MGKDYLPQKKLKVEERLALKKAIEVIPKSSKESSLLLQDTNLHQNYKKDILLELAH